MMRALTTAASGMTAQQTNLDLLANNLANANTTGYKAQHANFADLIYQTQSNSGNETGPTSVTPTAVQVGLGVGWTANTTDFSQGSLQQTNSPLNLAIQGTGFFQVTGADGTTKYTRDGSFQVDSNGTLVTSQGYPLTDDIVIPPGAASVSVSATGVVSATLPGESQPKEIGKITLATFPNQAGLVRLGNNLYAQGGASGDPTTGAPGENGSGTLSSGYVEGSNVQVVDEMVNMITAQRAYEINSKAIQTADDMLGVVNQIKGS